jgi:hypothetical protein
MKDKNSNVAFKQIFFLWRHYFVTCMPKQLFKIDLHLYLNRKCFESLIIKGTIGGGMLRQFLIKLV